MVYLIFAWQLSCWLESNNICFSLCYCWFYLTMDTVCLVSSRLVVLSHVILTHWGRVTQICVGKLAIIGSDNGLSPGRRQAIIWTNAGMLLIGPLGTNFSAISIGIQTFSFKKMHLKMSSAKWRPFFSASMSSILTHRNTNTHYKKMGWNYFLQVIFENGWNKLTQHFTGYALVYPCWDYSQSTPSDGHMLSTYAVLPSTLVIFCGQWHLTNLCHYSPARTLYKFAHHEKKPGSHKCMLDRVIKR